MPSAKAHKPSRKRVRDLLVQRPKQKHTQNTTDADTDTESQTERQTDREAGRQTDADRSCKISVETLTYLSGIMGN